MTVPDGHCNSRRSHLEELNLRLATQGD